MKQSFYTRLDPQNKYVLLCCFVLFSANGMITMILGSLLPLISDEYGLSNTISGSLLSAHQVGMMAAVFLAGILPFYLGRKRVLLCACAFAASGFVIMTMSGNPAWLIAGFLFTGLGRGSISNFCNSNVSEVSDGSAAALNLLHGIFAIGALITPFFVIFAVQAAGDRGWRIAAWIVAGFIVFAMLFFPRAKVTEFTKEQRKKLSYQFLKRKFVWYHIGAMFFYIGTEATVIGWLVSYFVNANIVSAQYAQILASILWAAILAGRLFIVFVGGRFSKNTILLLTSTGTAIFYAALLLSRNLILITFVVGGLGFSIAGIFPTLVASSGKIMKEYPLSLGVMLVIGVSGAIMMPLITGILSDRFGLAAGMSAVIVAMVLLLLFVILVARCNTEE